MPAASTIRFNKRYQEARAALIGQRVKARISYERSVYGAIKSLYSDNAVMIDGDDGREYYVQADRVDFVSAEAGK